jgi:hypothetical protein
MKVDPALAAVIVAPVAVPTPPRRTKGDRIREATHLFNIEILICAGASWPALWF